MDMTGKYRDHLAGVRGQGAGKGCHFTVLALIAETVGNMAEQDDWFGASQLRFQKLRLLLADRQGRIVDADEVDPLDNLGVEEWIPALV